MTWLELTVDTTREAVDWVTTVLAANGFSGDIALDERAAGDSARWRYTVRLYVEQNAGARATVSRLADALEPLRRVGLADDLQVEEVADLPARQTVNRLPGRRVGQRFVVLSDDAQRPADPQAVALRIPPGAAFGSGLHPATVACLHLIERHVAPGVDALDLGSGSGILSVALAKLGARVVALDNDPTAVATTRDAVVRNGVGESVTVAAGSLGRGGKMGHWLGWETLADVPSLPADARFDVIVANILARVHAELARDYRAALRDGGVLIVSGFEIDQEEAVVAALADADLRSVDRRRIADYVAVACRTVPPGGC